MKITGIYKIESVTFPYKIYIGSAINFKKRCSVHQCYLKKNKHPNQKLQNHYNKYGEKDFKFSIILICEKEDLIKLEQYNIDSFNPWFNILTIANSRLGKKHTSESILKMKKARVGRKPSLGKHWIISEDAKTKIREWHLGKTCLLETRKKMRGTRSNSSNKRKLKLIIRESMINNKNGCKITDEIHLYIINNIDRLTQTQLAKQLNLHQSTISKHINNYNYESNKGTTGYCQ